MVSRLSHLSLCFLGGCVLVTSAVGAREVPYECNDLVVVGQFAIVGEQTVPGSRPLSNWNSHYDLRLRIKRVLRGSESKLIIPATVVAHDPIRTDRDFLVVLRPTETGTYVVKAATLWKKSVRPLLVEPCR